MDSFQSLIRDAQFMGIITKPEPHKELSKEFQAGLELCERMSKLPFWCDDNHKHETNPNYHLDFCCTQHVAGLPVHPATKKEMPITPYQLEFVEAVMKAVTKPKGMTQEDWDRLEHMFHILKGRQMGFTEIVLRLIFHFCFTRYAGGKVGIIAAVNGKLSNKNLRRFTRLFKNIRPVLSHTIKQTDEGVCVLLVNETKIYAYPASEEAFTGDTNYVCVFMDESAKWKIIDDDPVFNSIMPIVRTNGADLFLVSTFKGPVKMFYKIYKIKDPDFIFLEYNILRTIGNLYTQEQVDKLITAATEDPEQEYMCKVRSGRDTIFGTVSNEDQQGRSEWLMEDTEDDGYVEDRSDDELIHHAV